MALVGLMFNRCFIFNNRMQEKDVKLKSIEESLQTARDSCSAREKMAEVSLFLCYSFWILLPSFFLFMLHSAESDLLF